MLVISQRLSISLICCSLSLVPSHDLTDLYRDAINTSRTWVDPADEPAAEAQPQDAVYRKHTDTDTDEHTFTDEWIEEGVFDDDVAVDTPREGAFAEPGSLSACLCTLP